MKTVRKKYLIYAMSAVFVLLTVLLAVINGISFTMVTDDADRITEMIAGGKGVLHEQHERKPGPDKAGSGRFDRMGPDSPELPFSVRYFTYRFDERGDSAEEVAFNISAFTKDEAESLAEKLKNETTGWTAGTYRYRVYTSKKYTYVTVVDQSRELLPTYRILLISFAGEIAGLIIFFIFLLFVSEKLFRPLEDADRRQKQFITEAESRFKVPLTVVSADTELIERENGPSDYTRSIHRQIKKMTYLTRRLGSFALPGGDTSRKNAVDLSVLLSDAIKAGQTEFSDKGLEVSANIEKGIMLNGDGEQLRRAAGEIVDNCAKFAWSRAAFSLARKSGRIVLTAANDTTLENGNKEQVFDRFTQLENADASEGSGLGLAYVKEIIEAHDGRISAEVNNGEFILNAVL